MEIIVKREQKFILDEPSQLGEIRRTISQWSKDISLNEVLSEKISIIINELGTNILKHAQRGEIIATINNSTINILSVDRGPGISDISTALRDGYSTHGTAGNGLGAVKRLATNFDIHSSSKGTVVYAQVGESNFSEATMEFFGFSLPIKGEVVSGDGWIETGKAPHRLLVCDGLGHGILAHEATRVALDAFIQSDHLDPLQDITQLHHALKSTRGAAVSVAFIDSEKKTLNFCGLGNVVGSIVGKNTKRLISYNGTAGVQMRKVQALTYPFEKNDIFIIHSDGLSTHWNLSDYPGLIIKHPLVIAGVLYRDHSRGNDDVTVVVGREKE